MTNEAIYKVLDLPNFCKRNSIQPRDGGMFSFGWALRAVKYLRDETAATSVTYPATLWLNNRPYDGEIEIYRDGRHAVRRV